MAKKAFEKGELASQLLLQHLETPTGSYNLAGGNVWPRSDGDSGRTFGKTNE
jgi:hypothetical protein